LIPMGAQRTAHEWAARWWEVRRPRRSSAGGADGPGRCRVRDLVREGNRVDKWGTPRMRCEGAGLWASCAADIRAARVAGSADRRRTRLDQSDWDIDQTRLDQTHGRAAACSDDLGSAASSSRPRRTGAGRAAAPRSAETPA
jgi:hypothetical protein